MKFEDFFKLAKKSNIDNIQITEKTNIESSFELINGKLESYDDYDKLDYIIKAEKNRKTIKIKSDYLDENIIDKLILNLENTDSAYEDEYIENANNITRNKVLEFTVQKELEALKELDSIRKTYSDVRKLSLYFSESYSNTRIINPNDIDISTDSHLCHFVVEVLVEKDNKTVSFDQKVLETDKTKIDFKDLIEDTIKKALIMIKKEKVETKKYNIILDSRVASNIISHLSSMLSATNIRNKVSCLEKKLNKEVFSKNITIIEDPTDKQYPGYRLFDDEGTITKKKCIVENGKIKTELYNLKEAKIKKIPSTGNSYGEISTKNMYVVPGNSSLQTLLENLSDGIYVTDYMGAQGTSINSSTGNISIQIFGFKIEKGRIKSGIEPCIMTTTIFELLSNVQDISDNLNFTMTSAASPDLLVTDISIAA